MGAELPFHQLFFFFFLDCFSAIELNSLMFIESRGGRFGLTRPLQEMSRKSLISLRFEPEIHLQSGKQCFVTIATELLKKSMSSNMRILVLMATAIAAYFGEKMCLAFFLPASWRG